jgi:PAS domain S-box-containing protein
MSKRSSRGKPYCEVGSANARAGPGDEGHAAVLLAALDAGPAGFLVADRGARIVAANVTACDLLGYSRSELLGRRVTDIALEPAAAEEMFAEMVRDESQRGIVPLTHRDGSTILVRYVAKAVEGGRLFAAVILPRRVTAAAGRVRERAKLSTREFEILALLSEGLENDQIARALHLAPDTVKAHVSRVLQKLDARSRTHAVALALRRGLVD